MATMTIDNPLKYKEFSIDHFTLPEFVTNKIIVQNGEFSETEGKYIPVDPPFPMDVKSEWVPVTIFKSGDNDTQLLEFLQKRIEIQMRAVDNNEPYKFHISLYAGPEVAWSLSGCWLKSIDIEANGITFVLFYDDAINLMEQTIHIGV